MEGVRSHGGGGNPTKTSTTDLSGQGSINDVPGCPRLAKWRIVKVEEKLTRDGKTYWWCPHHRRDNFYDGMYMEHDPGDGHKAWKSNLDKKKGRRKNKNSNTAITPPGTSDKHQLKLSGKTQASMMTDLKLSKDEVDRMMTSYNSDF